jgi:hypothetical protein
MDIPGSKKVSIGRPGERGNLSTVMGCIEKKLGMWLLARQPDPRTTSQGKHACTH